MSIGILESFQLLEQYGSDAVKNGYLSVDDILWASQAKKRKGCRLLSSSLSAEDIQKIRALGSVIKKMKENRK